MNRSRPGFYVHGKYYFGLDKRAQALAKAKWLESEYGRQIEIDKVDYEDLPNASQYEAA